jgi:hypothetical protein
LSTGITATGTLKRLGYAVAAGTFGTTAISRRRRSRKATTKLGFKTITVDGYLNNYVYYKNSSQAGGIDASGNFLGTKTYANYYNTKGVLIDDEIVNDKNDLIFGHNLWHQLQTGNESEASRHSFNSPVKASEEFGLAPAALTPTLQQRI